MKKIFVILFISICSIVKAQSGIEGKFVFAPGIGATEITLTKNFTYSAFVATCLDERTDSGKYEIDNDTLKFHTIYKPEEFRERPVVMEVESDFIPHRFKDSVALIISNGMGYDLYGLTIKINNIKLKVIDTISSDESIKIFPATKLSDSLQYHITVTYDTIKKMVPMLRPNYIKVTLHPDARVRQFKEGFDQNLLYKDDRLYMLDSHNKPYTIEIGKDKVVDAALKRVK